MKVEVDVLGSPSLTVLMVSTVWSHNSCQHESWLFFNVAGMKCDYINSCQHESWCFNVAGIQFDHTVHVTRTVCLSMLPKYNLNTQFMSPGEFAFQCCRNIIWSHNSSQVTLLACASVLPVWSVITKFMSPGEHVFQCCRNIIWSHNSGQHQSLCFNAADNYTVWSRYAYH